MFCQKFSSFAQLGARLLPKVVERKDVLKIVSILKRYPRYFASECITPTALRLWSDSGREHLPSNPFDDLGAWHRAEARSFLHNVTVDDVGTSSYIGLRETNEDDFKVIELEPDLYYFAVFDGHGGSASVEFVREHLHECVKHFYSYDKNMENVLINAFLKCNSDLEEYCLFLTERDQRNNVLHCGTTATVALLRDGTDLAVASVGDSGALICRMGDPVPLTNPHHPAREEEEQRIKSFNGWIDWSFGAKVNGRLAMTRSIGDFHLKPFGVIATPETQHIKVDHQTDSFIVLHTDGVSSVMSDKEITDIVQTCPDAQCASNELTSCALQYGSKDNITSIVIPLRLWGKHHSQQVSKEHSLLKNIRFNIA